MSVLLKEDPIEGQMPRQQVPGFNQGARNLWTFGKTFMSETLLVEINFAPAIRNSSFSKERKDELRDTGFYFLSGPYRGSRHEQRPVLERFREKYPMANVHLTNHNLEDLGECFEPDHRVWAEQLNELLVEDANRFAEVFSQKFLELSEPDKLFIREKIETLLREEAEGLSVN